jgi:hypothetical protein
MTKRGQEKGAPLRDSRGAPVEGRGSGFRPPEADPCRDRPSVRSLGRRPRTRPTGRRPVAVKPVCIEVASNQLGQVRMKLVWLYQNDRQPLVSDVNLSAYECVHVQ